MDDLYKSRNEVWREVMADTLKIFALGMAVLALALGSVFLFTSCRSQKATARTETVAKTSQTSYSSQSSHSSDTVRSQGKETEKATATAAMAETERTKITIARDSAGRPTEIIKERNSTGNVTERRNAETVRRDTTATHATATSDFDKSSKNLSKYSSKSEDHDRKYDGGYMKIGLGLCIFLFVINLATVLWGNARKNRQ